MLKLPFLTVSIQQLQLGNNSLKPYLRITEPTWLENVHVNLSAINRDAKRLSSVSSTADGNNRSYTRREWAIKALSLTDLTTLAGDDTRSNVDRLCTQAAFPFSYVDLNEYRSCTDGGGDREIPIQTAAICVYPARVADAHAQLKRLGKIDEIQIAAVATGFPSGQYGLATRLAEIKFACAAGATEIDIVLDRSLVLTGQWQSVYEELVAMRHACGHTVHMKAILAIGECGTMENVFKASMVAMMAGSDFIKTSTGKEGVNATLPVGLVMIRAIQEFRRLTGRRIGLKPAGGVRTVADSIGWMQMIQNTLGDEWLVPERFRFGASGLLDDIVKVVREEMAKGKMT